MVSRRYTATQAERLLAYRRRRIDALYFMLMDMPPVVRPLSREEAVRMISERYRSASRMEPVRLQRTINRMVAKLGAEGGHVVFHVDGADAPVVPERAAQSPQQRLEHWREYEALIDGWEVLRHDLLEI
ncbi:hypothetical protein E4K72_15280 [Oxalobacteraceae bacterium OM1]|nr:hypothetical protein E4K72_15280 [Oxalobacteraceae bacterium OM1]